MYSACEKNIAGAAEIQTEAYYIYMRPKLALGMTVVGVQIARESNLLVFRITP